MPPKLQSLLDDLAMFPDQEDRKLFFVDLADGYVHPSENDVPRMPQNKVPGCESEVYFAASAGRFWFAVENSQALLAKAFAHVLSEIYEGRLTTDIPNELPHIIFGDLSVGKSLGLNNMVYMLRRASQPS